MSNLPFCLPVQYYAGIPVSEMQERTKAYFRICLIFDLLGHHISLEAMSHCLRFLALPQLDELFKLLSYDCVDDATCEISDDETFSTRLFVAIGQTSYEITTLTGFHTLSADCANTTSPLVLRQNLPHPILVDEIGFYIDADDLESVDSDDIVPTDNETTPETMEQLQQ